MRPFERDDARVMALYRIPTPPGTGRALEVSLRPPGVLGRHPWPGGLAVTLAVGPAPDGSSSESPHRKTVSGDENLPFRDGSFDMLILHGTLEHLEETWREPRGSTRISSFLSRASAVLVPGGLVAGCVRNRFSLGYNLKRLGASLGVGRGIPASAVARRRFSVSQVRRVLESAGLTDIELFSVFPDDSAPALLFERDRHGAGPLWIRDLRARRHELSLWSYLAHWVVVQLGLKNLGCESIFFWGRKD